MGTAGHAPRFAEEAILWRCRQPVIGTRADGALPVMRTQGAGQQGGHTEVREWAKAQGIEARTAGRCQPNWW